MSTPDAAAGDRLRDRLLIVFLLFAALANYWALRDYVFEDAYITFRYAANLAAGEGFVFQAGEKVLGTSTPLFTLLLAACGLLGADIPAAGKLIFTLAQSVAAYLGFLLLARRGAGNAGVLFAVVVVSGVAGLSIFFGMETTLHLALILLAFVGMDAEKPWGVGLVLGLVCLDRYDGVVLAAAVLLVRFWARRRLPWREALVSGLLFGGWLLFARLYFGSFLPNTYAAKVADVPFGEFAWGSLAVQAQLLPRPLFRLPGLEWLQEYWRESAVLLLAPAIIFAIRAFWRRWRRGPGAAAGPASFARSHSQLVAMGLFALLLWLGYSRIGPPLGHSWYLVPATCCVLLLSLYAWSRLPLPAPWPGRLSLFFLVASFFLLPWASLAEAKLQTSIFAGGDRIEAYAQMARFVRHLGLEKTRVLTLEPGYLTYLSGQHAIDAAGLVTPGVFFHGPKERRSDFFDLLARLAPEMTVLGAPEQLQQPPEKLYLRSLTPAPGRHLFLRRDFFREHLDRLYAAWQDGTYDQGPAATWRHPLRVDFRRGLSPYFELRRTRLRRLPKLTLDGASYAEFPVLTCRLDSTNVAAWSQPFEIDFDELDFLFAANHPTITRVSLYIDGLLVYQQGGRLTPSPEARLELEKIALPLHAWRGRRGRLFFESTASPTYIFAADRIRSRRWQNVRVFDDFESGTYSPAIWQQGFGNAPIDNRQLAAASGLQMVQGRFAASSLFATGSQTLRSRPFRIDHSRISFTLLDFGDARTRVELQVAGQAVFSQSGSGSGSGSGGGNIVLVTWDLAKLAGAEATLVLEDAAEAAEIGLGIDSIVVYDPEMVSADRP